MECDAVLIGKLNSTEDLEQYAASFFRIYTILAFLMPRSGCATLISTAAGESLVTLCLRVYGVKGRGRCGTCMVLASLTFTASLKLSVPDQSARRHIPEDLHLHRHRRENLQSCIKSTLFAFSSQACIQRCDLCLF